jgi:MoxR-like ATPase
VTGDQRQALRHRAEGLAAPLPALLAQAEQLAASVLPGAHGRRRAGHGDEFWQYRAATASDGAARIDWRRSGRADAHFVRETEWQAAQAVTLWVDRAQAMAFSGAKDRPTKADRARLLGLALAVLLLKGGERVGLLPDLPPKMGRAQLDPLAIALDTDDRADFGAPPPALLPARSQAVFLSDFMGPTDGVTQAVSRAAGQGVRGVLVHLLDPVEEEFPYNGRSIFESMSGALRHETLRAKDLQARYRDRLAARKDVLATLARTSGWQVLTHHTDQPPAYALMALWSALDGGR